MSYGELARWVNENISTPDNEHEPYVIDYVIEVNDKLPKSSIVRIAISTQYLLKIALKRKHICADATYKLIWQGET